MPRVWGLSFLMLGAGIVLGACSSGGNDPPPAGVPKKLIILTQPPATVASRAVMNPAPVVQVLDGRDDPVAQAGISITAGLSSGSGTMTGLLTVSTDVNGQATFTNLRIQGLAGNKVLQFTSLGLHGTLSNAVALTAGPAALLVPNSSVIQNTLIGQAVTDKPSVRATDLDNNGVGNVAVTFAITGGNGSATGLNQTTNASGVATVGSWTVDATPGPNSMQATAAVGSPVNFTAQGVTALSQFTIDLQFITTPTPTQQAAFQAAKARWELIITGDLADVNVGNIPADTSCGNVPISGTIDDVKILVELKPYDGVNNVVGAATPCYIRNVNPDKNLTIIGYMFFDTADLANIEAAGWLSDVVLHEMGHVLGYGTIWEGLRGIHVITSSGPTGVGFTGTNAMAAFIGTNNGSGTVVPVEQDGGSGTARAHWDEEKFGSEIMTGYISGNVRPLSATSIASLADLGYTVNLGAANPFDYNNAFTLRTGDEPAPLYLGNDIIQRPVMYLEKGTGRTWVVPQR